MPSEKKSSIAFCPWGKMATSYNPSSWAVVVVFVEKGDHASHPGCSLEEKGTDCTSEVRKSSLDTFPATVGSGFTEDSRKNRISFNAKHAGP